MNLFARALPIIPLPLPLPLPRLIPRPDKIQRNTPSPRPASTREFAPIHIAMSVLSPRAKAAPVDLVPAASRSHKLLCSPDFAADRHVAAAFV